MKTRQATQGRTTVFTPVEGGEFKSYKTSGQAMTDQEALIKNDLRGGKRSAFENTFAEPKISPNESKSIMEHQVIQSGMSAEKASKALERADKALALSEKTRIDPTLREKARLIRQNPQQAKEILGNMSEEDFVKQIDTAVQQASQDVKGG